MQEKDFLVVSNPSRGTCAFGRESARRRYVLVGVVSNPSRGTCAFGQRQMTPFLRFLMMSQTPLGERVPSANTLTIRSQGSFGVSNPSRGTCAFGPFEGLHGFGAAAKSQTPLGERVPSAISYDVDYLD